MLRTDGPVLVDWLCTGTLPPSGCSHRLAAVQGPGQEAAPVRPVDTTGDALDAHRPGHSTQHGLCLLHPPHFRNRKCLRASRVHRIYTNK